MQLYKTKSLFYKKYLAKIDANLSIASIFRNGNLQYVKEQLDYMQRFADDGETIPHPSPFQKSVNLKDFNRACILYENLKGRVRDTTIRAEGIFINIYSNDIDWLKFLAYEIEAYAIHLPDEKEQKFLSENPNIVIEDNPAWRYKIWLNEKTLSEFAKFAQNNPNIRIGEKAADSISRGYGGKGYYFWTNNKKYIDLAVLAGASIDRVIKYVSTSEIA